MDDLPMSKKYKKFDLNTEKLNLHSQMGHLEQQEKKCIMVKCDGGWAQFRFHSAYKEIVFCLLCKTYALHDRMNKEIKTTNYPLRIYGTFLRN